MLDCEDGWDLREKSVAYLEACYFENTKSPVRSDRGGSLNINKTDGYDCIYKGCNNLMEGYTNIDGAKSSSLDVTATDWLPTQTTATYTQHYLDKTADVPALCQKYSGAGKVEIWTAYADAIPQEDIVEFDHAIKNPDPGNAAKTYDAEGNEMKGATSSISATENSAAATARVDYYTLSGVRISAPRHGVNIVRSIDADGHAVTKKVVCN